MTRNNNFSKKALLALSGIGLGANPRSYLNVQKCLFKFGHELIPQLKNKNSQYLTNLTNKFTYYRT